MRPAALRIQALNDEQMSVVWQLPFLANGHPAPLVVLIDSEPLDLSTAVSYRDKLYWVARATLPLQKKFEITVDGVALNNNEVIVSIENEQGQRSNFNLNSGNDSVSVDMSTHEGGLISYLWLGVEHILEGADHLLFVASLLLLVRGIKSLLLTITAFTLSHSVTLILASLGYINLPGPPVEAVIALSIVFVAREVILLEQGHSFMSTQKPWLVAFCFGLLHGLGFASVLGEIGLPEDGLVGALLMFNVGVELGQLLFVGVVLSLTNALARIVPSWLMTRIWPTYCIGAIAAFWMIERLAWF